MAHAVATVPPHASIGDSLISMSHVHEGRLKWVAFLIAVAIHCVALMINFPEIRRPVQPHGERTYIVVKKYVPPPPAVEHPQVVRQQRLTRRLPIPDPTPDQPEPIREPEPEIVPLPPDVEVLIGVPEPPPAAAPAAPLLAGVGDVTLPVLIEESRVQPEYPELARLARIEGNVVLQAVIHADGTVGELVVLRSTRPNSGFENAAVEAVRQWRYRPAMQNGHPVDVYFTVYVEFSLY